VAKFEDPEDRFGRRAAKNHPLKNLVYFVIAGICMLFFTLMAVFGFSNPAHFFANHHFPKAFLVSTVVIFVSSFFMERVRRSFDLEDGKALLNNLLIAFALAMIFFVLQFYGWRELWNTDITIYGVGGIPDDAGSYREATPSGAFLYVISGLHLLHLTGGLIFLFISMFKVVNVRSDDVRCVLYFSDRLERTRLEMLAKYWHFLGGLWFLLFIYFLWFFV
jgi:cytochrome c oxidase subunit III